MRFMLASLALAVDAFSPTFAVEPVTLWPLYQYQVRMPCEWVGYSFEQGWQSLGEMRAAGGEICGANRMWIPIEDPNAPYGAGIAVGPYKVACVAQRFRLQEPFTAILVQFPTWFQTGSATVTLWKIQGETKRPVARRRFEEVSNEYQARLDFPHQEAGLYLLQVDEPSGEIGLWLAPGELLEESALLIDSRPQPGETLEFADVRVGGEIVWHADQERHRNLRLGPRRQVDEIAAAGLKSMIWVGNWNNGAFPYYPDWFYQKFPDVTMLDLNGRPIMAGMFGVEKGWPSIDHPVIADGTVRYIKAVAQENLDSPDLIYWSLGGEALYPNYLWEWNGWPDYGADARAHFVAWLKRKYGRLADVNQAWGTRWQRWEDVRPPREQSVSPLFADWVDYRFAAMAERMSMHYAAVRSVDPQRLAVTTNHGNIFWSNAYAALGADLPQYADASDGFEMGQIMEGDDPGYFNLWYASALAGLGKVGAPARLAYKFPNPKARGGGTSYTPEAARRYCMEAFGSGWWHLGLIQWSGDLPDGEWGVKGTPAEQEIQRIFADLKQLRPLAEGSWALLPRIGLYFSHRQWILKGWDPRWTMLHTWLIQHQYDHAILWEQQLLNGEAEPYPVVISPYNDLIAPEAKAALERYLRRGGRLIVLGPTDNEDWGLRTGSRPRQSSVLSPLHLSAEIWSALSALPAALGSAGVRPFCRLTARGTVRWSLELEPLNGRHNYPPQLAPQQVLGQSFRAPGPWIRRVALRTPTYTKQPAGFNALLRLRRGGPQGEVIKEQAIPAEEITDNVWTGMQVEAPVTPGELLLLEITPDREIGDLQLGVWASTHAAFDDGQGYLNGEPQPWDLEFKVDYTVEMPSSYVVEAFTLFDGASFLVPLINLAQQDSRVCVQLDPGLIPGIESKGQITEAVKARRPPTSLPDSSSSFLLPPSSLYAVFDALSGEWLANGTEADITIPAKHYRVLWFRPTAAVGPVGARLAILGRRLQAHERTDFRLDFHRTCLRRAQAALADGRPEKALGYLQRMTAHPMVQATLEHTADGGMRVRARVIRWDGQPFAGAVGVLRAVPLPNLAAPLRETSPGRYEGTLPPDGLVAYDYAAQRYYPYRGPLQVIGNLWKGRTLAQWEWRVLRAED